MGDIEHSGFKATGLTLVNKDGIIETLKHNTNASQFFKDPVVETALMQEFQTIVGHCRFPTKGDASFNENNHPFRYGNSVIVHQGVLSNDEELKKKYGFKPEGETDSWIIVHLIEKYRSEGRSVIDAITATHLELKGSWAVALVDILEPDKLYLFCHYKTFKVNYYPDEEMFMFSTEDRKLDAYNTEIKTHFGCFSELRSLRFADMLVKTEQCLILGGEEEAKLWNLPAPETFLLNGGRRFGDGWRDEELEEPDKDWFKPYRKQGKGKKGTGRLPLSEKELITT